MVNEKMVRDGFLSLSFFWDSKMGGWWAGIRLVEWCHASRELQEWNEEDFWRSDLELDEGAWRLSDGGKL